MTIKATIDQDNVKYAISDNGYILALDNNENELFKYPIKSVTEIDIGYNLDNGSCYSAKLVFPDHEIQFKKSPELTPFVNAFEDELDKVRAR
ncbi:hypothetical protein [Paenibacillus sp. FSL R5-0810]|uniref:hypothetical protein n=1 Tax=Paenibacillus sp. FSL R5-0810 TaxID=2921659 RepID=UPI0030F6240C